MVMFFVALCGKNTTPHFYGSDAGTSCGTGPILVSKTSRNPSRFLWTRFESVVVVVVGMLWPTKNSE